MVNGVVGASQRLRIDNQGIARQGAVPWGKHRKPCGRKSFPEDGNIA